MHALDIITADDLAPVRHGFFTRRGGVSTGIYAGLNCGPGSGDAPEAVAENRARVARALGQNADRLATVHQVHSADVLTVTAPLLAPRPKCDAMVTATPGVVLGVLTADCQPVLFADPDAGVIGAAHAGWKGALGGVLEATVDAMLALGATRQGIRAVVGPTIGPTAYEVGPEFRDRFMAQDADSAGFFTKGTGDRWLFDLPRFGVSRLDKAGVAARWSGDCTFSDPDRFYSYRRTTHRGEADYGRLIAAIAL
jgi:YfiH family protein